MASPSHAEDQPPRTPDRRSTSDKRKMPPTSQGEQAGTHRSKKAKLSETKAERKARKKIKRKEKREKETLLLKSLDSKISVLQASKDAAKSGEWGAGLKDTNDSPLPATIVSQTNTNMKSQTGSL